MARFDKTEPYDEVHGLPGVSYAQAGHLFNAGGQEVTVQRWTDDEGQERAAGREVTQRDEEPTQQLSDQPEELRDLHHHTLAALLRQYGETYVNREQAIAFLQGAKELS